MFKINDFNFSELPTQKEYLPNVAAAEQTMNINGTGVYRLPNDECVIMRTKRGDIRYQAISLEEFQQLERTEYYPKRAEFFVGDLAFLRNSDGRYLRASMETGDVVEVSASDYLANKSLSTADYQPDGRSLTDDEVAELEKRGY